MCMPTTAHNIGIDDEVTTTKKGNGIRAGLKLRFISITTRFTYRKCSHYYLNYSTQN